MIKKTLYESLHENRRKEFEHCIEQLIRTITIRQGLDRAVPMTFSLKSLKQLKEILSNIGYINTYDVTVILNGFLENLIIDSQVDINNDKEMKKVCSDTCFILNAKDVILNHFYSLPFEFELLIPLIRVSLPEEVVVSESIKIIEINRNSNQYEYPIAKKQYPFRSSTLEYMIPQPDITYVAVKGYGCGNNSSSSASFTTIFKEFKILIAALYAYKILINIDQMDDGWLESEETLRYIFSNNYYNGCCFLYSEFAHEQPYSIKISDEEFGFLSQLAVNPIVLEPTKFEKILIDGGGIVDSQQASMKRVNEELKPIRKLFVSGSNQNKDQIEEIERVRTALLWFFEGLKNNYKTLSFIQFSTAIEALLGEPSEKQDVVKRLSDRCAFLTAEDSLERKKIKNEFEEAYKVRSKIIHTGKADLNETENVHYENIKNFLMKSLVQEVWNLPVE